MEAIAAAAAAAAAADAAAAAAPAAAAAAQRRRRRREQQQQRQQRWRFDIAGDTPVLAETTLARGGRWCRFSLDANKKTNQHYMKPVEKNRSHNSRWSSFFIHIFLHPQD